MLNSSPENKYVLEYAFPQNLERIAERGLRASFSRVALRSSYRSGFTVDVEAQTKLLSNERGSSLCSVFLAEVDNSCKFFFSLTGPTVEQQANLAHWLSELFSDNGLHPLKYHEQKSLKNYLCRPRFIKSPWSLSLYRTRKVLDVWCRKLPQVDLIYSTSEENE